MEQLNIPSHFEDLDKLESLLKSISPSYFLPKK